MRSVVPPDRDRHLLAELGVMRIIDREMTKLVAGFGSTTQVNTRLLELTRAGLLTRFLWAAFLPAAKDLHTLGRQGHRTGQRRTRSIDRVLRADSFVSDVLRTPVGINQIYLALRYRPIPRRHSSRPLDCFPAVDL